MIESISKNRWARQVRTRDLPGSTRTRSATSNKLAAVQFGGAGGVRTRDLLDAIEARPQLRYGPNPTEEHPL